MSAIDYSVIWTTRDGREVPLVEMDDRHISNAVALLSQWRKDCLGRGEADTARDLKTTLGLFKAERRRRLKSQRDDARLPRIPRFGSRLA